MARLLRLLVPLPALLVAAAPAHAGTLFTLTGHGFGHGIGMSQYGALGYARHGADYRAILGHYYAGTRVGPLAGAAPERVLLAGPLPAIDVATDAARLRDPAGAGQALAAGRYRIAPDAGGLLSVVDRDTGAVVADRLGAPLTLTPRAGALRLDTRTSNGYAGAHWRGAFRIVRTGASLQCIDVVPLERYVAGVVPAEMPASWPEQALRAQAVAARSYAVATRAPGADFDAYADTRSQVYGPIEHESPAASAAATATRAEVVWYGAGVATTFFSSSSGGRTASMQAAWGSAHGQPYLVPVGDPYDAAGGANPYHTWSPRSFSPAALGAALGLDRPVLGVDQVVDPPSRRLLSLTLHTPGGAIVRSAGSVYGPLELRSTYARLRQVTLLARRDGDLVRVRGRVWPRPGGAALEASVAGAPFSRLARLALDVDGRFAATVTVADAATLRVSTTTAAASPHVAVSAAPAPHAAAPG